MCLFATAHAGFFRGMENQSISMSISSRTFSLYSAVRIFTFLAYSTVVYCICNRTHGHGPRLTSPAPNHATLFAEILITVARKQNVRCQILYRYAYCTDRDEL